MALKLNACNIEFFIKWPEALQTCQTSPALLQRYGSTVPGFGFEMVDPTALHSITIIYEQYYYNIMCYCSYIVISYRYSRRIVISAIIILVSLNCCFVSS